MSVEFGRSSAGCCCHVDTYTAVFPADGRQDSKKQAKMSLIKKRRRVPMTIKLFLGAISETDEQHPPNVRLYSLL